ncbi:reverse transcriptase [Gossypium australe]|uniref:Reverse transcriptase n=1 Tax=Gossypium australe TaxID=47621 RepID=A0A5B6WVJ3_9ROSI|nr:reverse transcriptase [Gossypium australe]
MGFDPNWIDSIMKYVSLFPIQRYLMVRLGIFFVQREDYDKRRLILPYETGTSRRTFKRDDCILFGEATERGAGFLKKIMREYGTCSGQRVNFDKSTEEKRLVTRILGVRSSNDPERYLGLPHIMCRRKKEAFQNLKDKFKHLSQGGKEFFIKAILQAIPTYTMACFLLPKFLCADIESIIAKFWWQKDRDKRGIHWCAWKELCTAKKKDGLRFRSLSQFNIALLAKQAMVLKAKYYPNLDFIHAQLGNLPSLSWKSI